MTGISIEVEIMTPKGLEASGLIFWFHAYEALNEDRASVHVGKGSQHDFNDAEVWLEPAISVARAGRTMRQHELGRDLRIIEQNLSYLLKEWHDFKRGSD